MNFSSIKVNKGNFRSYDVRGEYPDEIDASTAYAIAQAFVEFNPAKRVAVGYDHRESTPPLLEGLLAGFADAGIDVIDIGQVTTDATYFASWNYLGDGPDQIQGTVMVTASHMPKQFNGFKFITKDLQPIGKGSGMEQLYEAAERIAKEGGVQKEQKGTLTKKDIMPDYLQFLWGFIDKAVIKRFKVVMDAGNGVAGPIARQVFGSLPIETTELCFKPDANFPNHEANPIIPENRKDIEAKVKAIGADLGIAWDADADRAYFIDEKGQFVHADFITALLAIQFLKKFPGSAIVYDLRASKVVPETVIKYGGTAHEERVGHAYIKRTMRKEDAVFGGEVSGHYYFKSNHFMDNGFIPPLLVLELMSEKGKPLSQLIADLGEYHVSGEINSHVKDQKAVIEALKTTYADAKQKDLDGISIDYPDWRCNVRPSANDPVMRLNLEANSDTLMKEKTEEVLAIIRSH